ncbi:MAG: xanthine dehydrogenase [Acidimicrobiaceae bacterium]|nr:xanthine dehydrogenase [Acidimicrobiaceae bacterium]|tara:strand:+ start:4984 stop:7206 length:2223 start_codon:yes stop_codon:yes gene_type:complete
MSSYMRAAVTGELQYLGDHRSLGEATMVVIRSDVARGRIRNISASAACRQGGVIGVFTADDLLAEFGEVPFIQPRLTGGLDVESFRLQPVLAVDEVRYVGEPVAVVLAESIAEALDAAELVEVDIEGFRASSSIDDGELLESFAGVEGDAECVFENAPVVIEREFRIGRQCPSPIEPRGLIARPASANDRVEIIGWTKAPHWNRVELARQLGIPPEAIRVLEVSVGGSFGTRGEFYPEDFLVPWCCLKIGRPVRWVEQRSEHFLAANQGRSQSHRAAIAGDRAGRILGIRTDFRADLGAYVRTSGVVAPRMTATMLAGPYAIPHSYAHCELVMTDRTPTGTYRGPGRVESCFVRERLVDIYADAIGQSPTEVRLKNLIGEADIPIQRQPIDGGPKVEIDEGHWEDLFQSVVSEIDWSNLRHRRSQGERIGVGLACFIERSGLGPWESASVKVDSDGGIEVRSGCTSVGQGLEETFEKIAASSLGVDGRRVRYLKMDSDVGGEGIGTFASRSTVMGGNAVHLAALEVIENAKRALEVRKPFSGGDWEYVNGVFISGEGERRVTLAEVASDQDEGYLFAEARFENDKVCTDFGAHAAQVLVDSETGKVEVERLILGFDVGPCISEENVKGQLYGGAVQAVGGALFEEVLYDEYGSPLVTTLLDYGLASAVESPEMTVILETRHPSPLNPLGVKGCGEGGITGTYAAIANAVSDAMQDSGFVNRLPIRMEEVASHLRDVASTA